LFRSNKAITQPGVMLGIVPNYASLPLLTTLLVISRAGACARRNWKSIGVTIAERCAHGVDRNPRYEAREEEPGDTNPDRKCAPERLPRYDIAITNREASDEGKIDRVADRPAFDKANQQAQDNLNRQNYRQDRPRDMNGVAKGYEKAPPHGL
jgi:hypothetical protein